MPCTFCGMYKDKKYRVRTLDEIKEDIRAAQDYYRDMDKVFLCDGDAVAIETGMLLEILAELKRAFPSLRHVGTYVGPASTLAKSMDELRALREAGLTKAYLGVETGDDRLLKEVHKGRDSGGNAQGRPQPGRGGNEPLVHDTARACRKGGRAHASTRWRPRP